MNKVSYRLIVPLAVLALAALACSVGGSDGGDGATAVPDGPRILYRDDFSDSGSGWAVDSDDTGAVGYTSGEYFFSITKDKWFTWSNPDESFTDIRLSVTVRDITAKTEDREPATFGAICNYEDDQNFYYAGFGADGYYALVNVEDNEDKFLSDPESNQWLESDDITLEAESYTLELECAKGRVALYVDGKEIASASDSTHTRGDIGLFVLTFTSPTAEVRFDNLQVTEVK
jgi:hypothetical protein